MAKRTITKSIALTPELLASINREPITLIAQAIQDTTGWTITKSTMALNCPDKLGWTIGCPSDFNVRWTGEESPESLHIDIADNQFNILRLQNGTIGFELPWLFKIKCPHTGLSVRSIPNQFNSHICVLDSISLPKSDSHKVIIYWKIMTTNTVIDIKRNTSLGFIQPFNVGLWNETSLVMEEFDASHHI